MNTPTDKSENFIESSLGVAMECNILKEKMRRAAEKCGSALLLYYIQSGNPGQEKSMRYMLKDLLYSKTEETEYLCEIIYDQANTHLAAAMKHGYTPEDLAELRSSLNQYGVIAKNKRKAIANKKQLEEIMQDYGSWGRKAA